MLAVQHFYAWTEYNTSKLSLTPPSSGLLSNLQHVENLRLTIYSKPIQITKSIVIALVSNLALVDKFAKQSVTIFHADINANCNYTCTGYRHARQDLQVFQNCERVYTNLSNAFAAFGFDRLP